MNFKTLALLVCLVLGSSFSYSQNFISGDGEIKTGDVEKLRTGMLYVIEDNPGSEYGKALESAFSRYWKFSKFTFIKPSELSDKLNDKNAGFFAFSCMIPGGTTYPPNGVYIKGAERPFADVFIDSNSIPLERKKEKNFYMGVRNEDVTYIYTYGIFMLYGNTKYDDKDWLSPYNLIQTVRMLDYIYLDAAHSSDTNNIYVTYKSDYKYQLFGNTPLYMAREKTLSEIPFYVLRLEKHLEYISNNGRGPKTKSSKTKIVYACKGEKNDENADIISYDNGLEKIKSLKILVDSCLTDNFGKKLLAKSTGISEDNIQLVSWNDILNAVDKHDPNVAVVFTHYFVPANREVEDIWSTDGTLLINWTFEVHRHKISPKRWDFSFPKKATYGVNRNEIQILN